eukprot:m.203848 g.203848  ORF g.203848 m.203848 type:complete len:750 (-) comp32866_c0_seq2:136-2385(-)
MASRGKMSPQLVFKFVVGLVFLVANVARADDCAQHVDVADVDNVADCSTIHKITQCSTSRMKQFCNLTCCKLQLEEFHTEPTITVLNGNLRINTASNTSVLINGEAVGLQSDIENVMTMIKNMETNERLDYVTNASSGFVATSIVCGAVGDGKTDDTIALQRCIDLASVHGRRVVLPATGKPYKITGTLVVPSGVTLIGDGIGEDPRNINYQTGTILRYCGDAFALRFNGDNSGARHLAISADNSNGCSKQPLGGVEVRATSDHPHIESCIFKNIFIFLFVHGTALVVHADQGCGIAYNQFYDIRIRYALRGIEISADEGGFTNSNHFRGGAISGQAEGGMEYAILNKGPGPCNQNTFTSMTIEPQYSRRAHVIVEGAGSNIEIIACRLEASLQLIKIPKAPIIFIAPESIGNVVRDTMIGHTHIVADFEQNPGIDVATGKTLSIAPSRSNRLQNAVFRLSTSNATDPSITLPAWTFARGSDSVSILGVITEVEESYGLKAPLHRCIAITLDANTLFTLSPTLVEGASTAERGSFGVHAYVNNTDVVLSASMKHFDGSRTATVATTAHTGNGTWQFVGLSSTVGPANTRTSQLSPTIVMHNKGNTPATVMLTSPMFSTAQAPPVYESPLLTSGGTMEGTFVNSVVSVSASIYCKSRIILPKPGNVFDFVECDGDGCATKCFIDRINSDGERFAAGTIVTLLLPSTVVLRHSPYVNLLGATRSSTSRTSRWTSTLIADPSGTWREINRGE